MSEQLIPGTVIEVRSRNIEFLMGFEVSGAIIGTSPQDPTAGGTAIIILDLVASPAGDEEPTSRRYAIQLEQAGIILDLMGKTHAHMVETPRDVLEPPEDARVEPFGVRMLSTADGDHRYHRGQLGVATHVRPPVLPGQIATYRIRLAAAGDASGPTDVWALESEFARDDRAKEALA